MNYTRITFEHNYEYVGLRYLKEDTDKYGSIPEFWQHFTMELYNSTLLDSLIDNNEAIGYRDYISSINSYNYYAACPIHHIDSCLPFHKIIIPKGEYILFQVNNRTKDEDIKHILQVEIPQVEKKYNLNKSFNFEYYTSEFDYKDPNTIIYLAVQILQ